MEFLCLRETATFHFGEELRLESEKVKAKKPVKLTAFTRMQKRRWKEDSLERTLYELERGHSHDLDFHPPILSQATFNNTWSPSLSGYSRRFGCTFVQTTQIFD